MKALTLSCMRFKWMKTRFEEIDEQTVKKEFPQFYDKRGRFFEIIHQEQPIGFVGIRPLSLEECELEVYVFPHYRNTLTKGLMFDVLDFPGSLGFRRGVMTTTRPKLLRWLHFLVKCAKLETGFKNGKPYFMRQYP